MPYSLFAPRISDSKAHPLFLSVRDHPGYRAGRRLLDETFALFGDQDGNFVKDFQGPGFSARIWELSLFAYLQEGGVPLAPSPGTPDYLVDGPAPFAVEATTTQPGQGQGSPLPSHAGLPQVPDDLELAQNQFVLQLGKALRNKLLKRFADGSAYWELPHTQGLPFVVAVEAFHAESSLFHSVSFAAEYLYGTHTTGEHDDGNLTVTNSPIASHTFDGKTIPSSLFLLPEAEHLSGVLFSNGGTAAQFNRIGAQRGYADKETRIVRMGTCADPDPNAVLPRLFGYVVGDGTHQETFAEAMHVLHNPHAAVPLPIGALPQAAEWTVEGGLLATTHHGFSPFAGLTSVYHGPGADDAAEQALAAYLG